MTQELKNMKKNISIEKITQRKNMPENEQVVQMQVAYDPDTRGFMMYGLSSAGRVWIMDANQWVLLEDY